MDTKLTLKLNQSVIEQAKQYAVNRKISLSKIVENYLQSLTARDETEKVAEISPFVKSMSTWVKVSPDFDYKKEYSEHLSQKHR